MYVGVWCTHVGVSKVWKCVCVHTHCINPNNGAAGPVYCYYNSGIVKVICIYLERTHNSTTII